MDPVEGPMTEAPTSERIATQLHRIARQRVQDGGISVPQRPHDLRSRMRYVARSIMWRTGGQPTLGTAASRIFATYIPARPFR